MIIKIPNGDDVEDSEITHWLRSIIFIGKLPKISRHSLLNPSFNISQVLLLLLLLLELYISGIAYVFNNFE
jgi:hypothetical protein